LRLNSDEASGDPDVRLSERKIRYLSDRIVTWMERRGDVEFLDRADVVALAVARAIALELKQEDDLDDEVEKMLKDYQNQIRGQNMDLMLLRQKIKAQLARERGIVL
jgi:hypothetical protein